jgi:hypothetical protein
MRRSIDGRWQVGQDRDEFEQPIDPEARVVTNAVERPSADTLRR